GPATGRPAQTPTTLDDATSTHFHNQARGVNGPVVFGQINPAQDNDDLAIVLNPNGSWTVRAAGKQRIQLTYQSPASPPFWAPPRSDRMCRSTLMSIRTNSLWARSGVNWSPSPMT